MSDAELTEQPQGHSDQTDAYHTTPIGPHTEAARGGRRKAPRTPNNNNRQRAPDHWNDLQELRGKLAEHDETMAKLKSAFSLIAVALDLNLPDGSQQWHGVDTPAHRPPRLSAGRRGGANCVNSSHYKNNNRGGGFNPGGANPGYGGYRANRGNSPGFRAVN